MTVNIKLVTSNVDKLNEFKRLSKASFLMEKGLDLPEVVADPLTVILHKSKAAGKHTIVEDTILIIDGEPVVDIKFKLAELNNLKDGVETPAVWQTMLGFNWNDKVVYVYCGEIRGFLRPCNNVPEDAFGFDPFFYPNGQGNGGGESLYELEKEGRKDEFSARKNAVDAFNKGNDIASVKIRFIYDWKGEYQG